MICKFVPAREVRTEERRNVEYKTQTRQQILDCMIENPDRIFKASELAQNLPSVSLSTIYRNLSRLEKAGVVQIVGAEENKELQYRYTGPGRCQAKMHLVCKDCGKFFHLDGPALKMLQISVQRVSGFELDQQQSVLLGRCAGCSRTTRTRKRRPECMPYPGSTPRTACKRRRRA